MRRPSSVSARIDDLDLKLKAAAVLDRWPSAGLAAGVVRDGSLERVFSHGVSDIESKEAITQDSGSSGEMGLAHIGATPDPRPEKYGSRRTSET